MASKEARYKAIKDASKLVRSGNLVVRRNKKILIDDSLPSLGYLETLEKDTDRERLYPTTSEIHEEETWYEEEKHREHEDIMEGIMAAEYDWYV